MNNDIANEQRHRLEDMSRPNPSYVGMQGMIGDLTISTYPLPRTNIYSNTSFFQVIFPALLQGGKCYTDTTISLDQPSQLMRKAGIRVFILEPRRKLMIEIKETTMANSVLMGEAKALSLAGTILSKLQIQDNFFLTG